MKLEIITKDPIGERKAADILCVHGLFTSAWMWDQGFMDFFANRGYRIHALSLRGRGKSAGTRKWRWWSAADYVEDLQNVYAAFKGRPLMVGVSTGAFYLLKLLERQRPPAAALLAPVPHSGLGGAALRLFNLHPVLFMKMILQADLRQLVASKELCREYMFSAKLPAEEMVRYCRKMERESFRAFLDLMIFTRVDPRKVDSPVLLVGSESDNLIKPRETRKTARALNAELEMLSEPGHQMVLDRGWEQAARRTYQFFQEQGY